MDYSEIIDNLQIDSVISLMEKLGATRYVDKGGYIIFPTICHNTDSNEASMKLYFYKDTKLFVCYTECGNMSIFKFLKYYYETRQIEYDWYEDIYQVILDCSNYKEKEGMVPAAYHSLKDKYNGKRKEKELPAYSDSSLGCFVKNYPEEWLSDGISKEAMDRFNILYSISQNKIIIPHYDVSGRLVGIRGRALTQWEIEEYGKYMPVRIEQTWYKHPLSMNLYGLKENLENIKKHRIVYLFEAEKSVLQMDSFNLPNCAVAVCGSSFNKYQLNLLLKHCAPEEIIICFDKEELPGEDKYFNKLYAIGEKYKNYCNFSFIYDRVDLLDLKDSPSDKGEEIFTKLLNRRVKIR